MVTQPQQKQTITTESVEGVLKKARYDYLKLIPETKSPVVVACIPAYNEESSIAGVIHRTQQYVDVVIVCDDGSVDLTAEIAGRMGAFVVRQKENHGKGEALRCALREALKHVPDYIVVLDADGQHNPDDIPILVEPLHSGEADMVIGSRYIEPEKQDIPLYRRFGLGIIDKVFTQGINKKISDSQSGFRSFTKQAAEQMIETTFNGFGADSEQISLATTNGLRILEVPVKIKYIGLRNTSKKNPFSHGTEIISSILNLVIVKRPILLLGTPGILSLMIGLFALGFFVYYYNLNGYVSVGFAMITM